jgi:hypothetical protein
MHYRDDVDALPRALPGYNQFQQFQSPDNLPG